MKQIITFTQKSKSLNRGFFSTILIAFLLPFFTISCQDTPIARISGKDLVTGQTIETPGTFTKKETEKIPPTLEAIVAFLAALIGLIASFARQNNSTIPASTGSIGFIMLLMLKEGIKTQAIQHGQGLLSVTPGLGFHLAFFMFLATTIINGTNLYAAISDKKEKEKENLSESSQENSTQVTSIPTQLH